MSGTLHFLRRIAVGHRRTFKNNFAIDGDAEDHAPFVATLPLDADQCTKLDELTFEIDHDLTVGVMTEPSVERLVTDAQWRTSRTWWSRSGLQAEVAPLLLVRPVDVSRSVSEKLFALPD